MKSMLKAIAISVVAMSASVISGAAVQAADWPQDKPIRIIFPFPAGPDFLVRLLAADLERQLGQTVIVENKPGAGGTVGMSAVAHAKPDGYTFVVGYPGPSANYTNTYSGLPYTPLEDFDYISQLMAGEMVVIARADFPANTLDELLAYVEEHPSEVTAGHPGIGSYGHMIELMMVEKASADLKIVPYQGSAPIIIDLLSGSLDISTDFLTEAYTEHLRTGSMKALGFATAKRNPNFADVQTFQEAGVDLVATAWAGLMAPKGTPPDVIEKMNAAIGTFLISDEAKETFTKNYQNPAPSTPGAFAQLVADEEALWRDIIKKYEIRNN